MERFTNQKKENLHAGHRERMRNNFMRAGLDGFSDHQIIEMLLFYTYPRRDTNELAHKLVRRFNGLAGVLDASEECLEGEGLTKRTVILFKLFRDFFEAVSNNVTKDHVKIPVADKVKQIMTEKTDEDASDNFYAVYLNNDFSIIAVEKLITRVDTDPHDYMMQIVDSTVYHNSASSLVARNYTDIFPSVSETDVYYAKVLSEYHNNLQLRFTDYLIIGRYSSFSLRDSCYGNSFID